MSEKLLQGSRQMTKSWQEIVSFPNCFKTYQALGTKELDQLRGLKPEQLERENVHMKAIASYLQSLDNYLKTSF